MKHQATLLRTVTTAASIATLLLLAGCDKPAEQQAVTEQRPETAAPVVTETVVSESVASENRPTQVFWGDQHVHTGWSTDAGLAGTTLGPEEAVRFALGEEVNMSTGEPAQLHRKLDWVAVTDHSDAMGTISEIMDGNPEMMADPTVKRWHDMLHAGPEEASKASREAINAQAEKKVPGIMMDPKWTASAWEKTVDIMEQYYDPGEFTTFIAYEWTSNGEVGQNLHRNVIFRDNSDKTRATPPLTTFVTAKPGVAGTDPESLWQWMGEWEEKTGGKVLAIPHNGNMSNGWMFRLARYDGSPMTEQWAADRARWEPLYEVFQYKGSGETHPTMSPNDEFADHEIWDTADLSGHAKQPDDIKYEYLRNALKNGMKYEDELGTNPFKYGMVSGTDTHIALMTGGEEDNYLGKYVKAKPEPGRWDKVARQEETYVRKEWTYAAQGLTGVWATENTRESLWDALKRREVYASTGPRMTLRFFAGYDFTDADASGDIAAVGYAKGVTMGRDLAAAEGDRAPTFLVAASKDPDGANLDRVQIIKGWVDDAGKTHEKIYNVAWSDGREIGADGELPAVGNTVNLSNATYTNSIGAGELIASFTDPDFDASQKAFYYARVLEIPTPRWTAFDAVRFNTPVTDPDVPMVLQERATSSPIWYTP